MSKRRSTPKISKTPGENRRNGSSADQLTEQNVETVTRLEEAAREQQTPTDRVAEKIASFCGSMAFVWVQVVWFGGWILLNSIPHIDPFPFTFLKDHESSQHSLKSIK